MMNDTLDSNQTASGADRQRSGADRQRSGADWQRLGALEIPVGADLNELLDAWLVESLAPLNLNTAFLEKVYKAVHQSAADAIQAALEMRAALEQQSTAEEPSPAELPFDHVHLLLLTPANRPHNGKTWGFFRMEKRENGTAAARSPDHVIEFYLYLEG